MIAQTFEEGVPPPFCCTASALSEIYTQRQFASNVKFRSYNNAIGVCIDSEHRPLGFRALTDSAVAPKLGIRESAIAEAELSR